MIFHAVQKSKGFKQASRQIIVIGGPGGPRKRQEDQKDKGEVQDLGVFP